MFKVTGLDKLTKELEDAQRALAEIDGDIGNVSLDPHDPASIERAIVTMEQMIDAKVGRYAKNAIVGPMIEQMKEQYRAGILQKAAAARLSAEE